MAKILPMALQIKHARRTFCDLNPPCDAIDDIDFKHSMDRKLSYPENLSELEAGYPEFRWRKVEEIKPRAYEKMLVDDLRDQAATFNYDLVRESKLKKLERQARKLPRVESELAVCKIEGAMPRVTPPGTCRVKTVHVDEHFRCLPRQG